MFTGKWIIGLEGAEDVLAVREACGLGGADETDALSKHAALLKEGKCVGTGRLFYDKDGFEIDNVCVLPEYRGTKVGDTIMRMLIWLAFEHASVICVRPTPETRGFFARYGFAGDGLMELRKESYICGCGHA